MPSDDFNRADGSIGANWGQLVGTWTIDANQAECNDNDGGTGYYCRYDGSGADVGSSDMWSEGVTNSSQTGGISNAGVAVRHRTGATTGYQFTSHTNDSCAFWRIVAGSETQITTFTTAVAVGDTIRLEAVGRTLRAKVNGALRALATDTNITDGQRGALNGYNENATGDVVRFDSWAAGLMTALLAPYLVDWSAQTARSTGASMTPTIPVTPAAGDLVLAEGTVRSTADTISPPAGEGWSQIELASGNSLRTYVWGKIWGLGGQTDDTTPTFTRTGTTGAFVTCAIYRNPAHATAPWTSVASAVVASGQQSNAAAATATAPSVTHTGGHRTVVRVFGSADDNALNAPSTGVLVYGGAAFDATDIAQAMSVAEDITVTTNTGTATVAESVNGNDASNGVTLVLAIPAGSAVTGVGSVTGTGGIAGAGVAGVVGAATVVGTGAVAGAGTVGRSGSGAVTGTGAVAGSGQAGVLGAGTVSGGGAVAASGARGVVGAGAVAGAGQIAAQGHRGTSGSGTAAGVGVVSGAGVVGVAGAGSVSGVGAITGAGVAQGTGTGSGQVTGTGSVVGAAVRGVLGQGGVSAVGAISGTGARAVAGAGTVGGVGAVSGRGFVVGQNVPSQGDYDTGGGALIYEDGRALVYDRPGAGLVYDP